MSNFKESRKKIFNRRQKAKNKQKQKKKNMSTKTKKKKIVTLKKPSQMNPTNVVENLNRNNNRYYSLMYKMDRENHPLAQEPMNNDYYQELMNENYYNYLDSAYNQSKKILKEEEFNYRDYPKVFKKEINSRRQQERIEKLKRNRFTGTLDEFEFPPKSLNNKRILVMMAHSDICPYDTFKKTFTSNASRNIIPRTEFVDSDFYDIQVLSTQTIGRPGYQIFYKFFYDLLDNDIWFNALLEIEKQSDAENLNLLFKYLYTFYRTHEYYKFIEHFYGKNFKGKKVMTNFRIYPKKTNPKYPMDQYLSFYPSYNDEVRGIFNFTTIKKKGKYSKYSLIMKYMYDIKKCFKEQVDEVNKQLKNRVFDIKTSIGYKKLQELRLKKIQTALLIPDEQTIEKLKEEFKILEQFAHIKPTYEIFLQEIQYNLAIYNIYYQQFQEKYSQNLADFDIKLSTILRLVREVSGYGNILLVENSCKKFSGSTYGSNQSVGDLISSQQINHSFDYKTALLAKRQQSRNGSNNLTLVPESNKIEKRNKYIELLKQTENRNLIQPDFYSNIIDNPNYKKYLKDFNKNDFIKLLEELEDAKEFVEETLVRRTITAPRSLEYRDDFQNLNLQIYLIQKIINTFETSNIFSI